MNLHDDWEDFDEQSDVPTTEGELPRRARITGETIDAFAPHAFAFGKYDCGKMVISHLKAMGWTISTGGTWQTAIGLKRFLRRHGGSGAAAIDGWGVPRIAPACAILGDIVEMEGEPPFGAFGVCVGNGRVLAYHEDADGAAILQPRNLIAAWRT